MLHSYNMPTKIEAAKEPLLPVRKIHFVGTSAVLTIDQKHVRRLKIDELTFFVQRPTHNGILLEINRLQDSKDELKEDENKMNVVDGESFPGSNHRLQLEAQ
jgi:hypothetical protein